MKTKYYIIVIMNDKKTSKYSYKNSHTTLDIPNNLDRIDKFLELMCLPTTITLNKILYIHLHVKHIYISLLNQNDAINTFPIQR